MSKALERLYREVLNEIGAFNEPDFMDIVRTPKRVARMLTNELLVGYRRSERSLMRQLRMFPAEGQQEMVVQGDIPLWSMCAHHMLPFSGTATIGYLPGSKLLGLSKLSRILDFYSARLQLQERLGAQVADFIVRRADAQIAIVMIRAEHGCMACRGVRKAGVQTVTTSVRPHPPDETRLEEFYRMARVAGRR